MAQIKMDVSEYEAMQENKKLLEESLKREKELSAEVSKLQKDKIEALRDAQKKIIKINKHVTREYIIPHLSESEMMEKLNREFYYWADMMHRGKQHRIPDHNRFSMEVLGTSRRFADLFFSKEKSHDMTTSEEITTHGLDEIKAELKTQLESEMTTATKQKLEKAAKALKKESEYLEKIDNLLNETSTQKSEIRHLEDMLKSLEKNLESVNLDVKLFQELKDAVSQMGTILYSGASIWNLKRLFEQLKDVYSEIQEKIQKHSDEISKVAEDEQSKTE